MRWKATSQAGGRVGFLGRERALGEESHQTDMEEAGWTVQRWGTEPHERI